VASVGDSLRRLSSLQCRKFNSVVATRSRSASDDVSDTSFARRRTPRPEDNVRWVAEYSLRRLLIYYDVSSYTLALPFVSEAFTLCI